MLILDDKEARKTVRKLGLRVIGTLGILILAKKQGLIEDLEAEIGKLLEVSFYISQDVITRALEEARKDC